MRNKQTDCVRAMKAQNHNKRVSKQPSLLWSWHRTLPFVASSLRRFVITALSSFHVAPLTIANNVTPHSLAMGFLENMGRAIDGIGVGAVKHVGPIMSEASKHAGKLGQDAYAYAAPMTQEAWNKANGYGREAGIHIGPAAQDAFV